ncbi:hypothetical protein DEI91_11040 [Curtobacterium sp. MCBD17_032]|nr:hypothetical protein DEI91_11040 [Curtobacterium sp. MCBD17_032]
MVALIILITAVYGALFRRTTWLRLPRKRSAGALGVGVAFVVLIGSTSAFGATHPTPPTPAQPTAAVTAAPTHTRPVATPTQTTTPKPTPTRTAKPVVTTKRVTETAAVPFSTTTVESATAAKGTSSVTTAGVDGIETKTFTVTYTDGVETGRTLTSTVITTPPIAQVTTVGTYVAPPAPAPPMAACTNGSYVNSAGESVCRPEVSTSAPSGATAHCVDGTYSFSQSRRGTCSSHGGVASWL